MKKITKKIKPEIMSPIRDWASLEACKDYADAIYFGLSDLTMRANADIFTLRNMGQFVKKCHAYKIKAYLTVNPVIYNDDLKIAEKIIKKAKQVKVDAVIVWDPAVIELARKYKIKFFISTQANISNYKSALFYKKQGAARVVLAREMTLKQIAELSARGGSASGGKKYLGKLEIETFVHGAMCWSISGRCLLSAAIYGKSANCGSCGQPCRKKWTLKDNDSSFVPTNVGTTEGKPCRKEWTLQDDEGHKIANQGKYYMSAKDLCMIEHIPALIKAGIDSFKIEGRRRDPRYIEITAKCYREAVDAYFDNTFTKEKVEHWKKELASVYNRGFETGFYFGDPGKAGISYDKSDNVATKKKVRIGKVTKYYPKLKVALIRLTERDLKLNQEIYIEGKQTYLKQLVASMEIESKQVKQASKGKEVGIKVGKKVKVGDDVFIVK